MQLTVGQCVSLACLLEASSPKPGNVHRGADFDDATFYDFLVSAIAVETALGRSNSLGLGERILAAVQSTSDWVGTNTNLGIVLLLAPLAQAATDSNGETATGSHQSGMNRLERKLREILQDLTENDCRDLFLAIRIASPGGLGKVSEMDVNESSETGAVSGQKFGTPEVTREDSFFRAMELAKDRDSVALQFCNGFQQVFQVVVPALENGMKRRQSLPAAIVDAYLEILSAIPDTLVARKCGTELSVQISQRAGEIQAISEPAAYRAAIADFDFWLRSDGHRRNPGTTADLVTAGLFLMLRTGQWNAAVVRQALEVTRFSTQTGI